MDQPDTVANPARGQLNRENGNIFVPVPVRACEFGLVRQVSAVPSRVSLLILHTHSGLNLVLTHEIHPALRDGSRQRPHLPSTDIGLVPNQSGHAIMSRWRSLPRARWHRAISPQGSYVPATREFYNITFSGFTADQQFHVHTTV